jgi:YVTN family beta-propeller protein
MRRRTALTMLAGWLATGCATRAGAPPLAYVSNEKSGTVTVIDTVKDVVVGQIALGGKPRGMALHPSGGVLYVSDQPSGALVEVDLASRRATRSIPLGESPEGVSISTDGSLVAAAIEVSNSVLLLDTASGAVVANIATAGRNPEHAVFSPDGRWLASSALT